MFDVIVVGAGPVGLFLGALLLQEGLSVRILEQRTGPSTHSRAIGIHPPALAALDAAGVAAAMVAEGVQIGLGIARSSGTEVARLSFAKLSVQYPFVLALPKPARKSCWRLGSLNSIRQLSSAVSASRPCTTAARSSRSPARFRRRQLPRIIRPVW